ncbi:hypothetical protein [Streptomyces sp. G1]|uniref:hypothetical protein n=1 Tax=Streptomyces sp. G1 TaxID=361572 RepID=UPI00202F94EA|nr:hypothetical protein [Streptomyces sp. G1]MCM1967966.1 hypothetical protein [Streptomyces sp. G1]
MPKNHFSEPRHSARTTSSVWRRTLIGAIVLTILTGVAGLLAYLTRDEPAASAKEPVPRASATLSAQPGFSGTPVGSVAAPPRTSDPITFAKAAAQALWNYDTRALSQPEHLAGLQRWMTSEAKYADWASVTKQVPDPVLWTRLHDNQQHVTATIGEGHFPEAFKSALAADPGAITTAYVYAVTVSGRQSIAWTGSGAGAEARSLTVAVQCRPQQDCALAGVLPNVAP